MRSGRRAFIDWWDKVKKKKNYLNVSEVEYLLSMFHVCASREQPESYIILQKKVYKLSFHKEKKYEQEIYSIKTTLKERTKRTFCAPICSDDCTQPSTKLCKTILYTNKIVELFPFLVPTRILQLAIFPTLANRARNKQTTNIAKFLAEHI